MGLLRRSNAWSIRVFSILTVIMAYVMYPSWGLASTLIVIVAGVYFYIVGGNPDSHGLLRRFAAVTGYGLLLVIGIGIGV